MYSFNVRVKNETGDISIYTNAKAVEVNPTEVVVKYDDHEVHSAEVHELEDVSSVTITKN